MALTLTVLHGQANGATFTVTPARSPAMIGRSPLCAVIVEGSYVSETHAAVYFDAAGARVRDLDSHTGTWVNGAAVQQQEAPLRAGDRLQIGQTLFGVDVTDEAHAPPQDDALAELAAAMQTTPRDCVRFALRAEDGALYALVDLAGDRELLELLNESGEQFCALDETAEPDALGEAAPCLVSLSREGSLLGDFVESVWGGRQAVFFTSDSDFGEVYAHWLRATEYDDAGQVTSPRVWMPEVLAETLMSLEGEALREFFGPARAFFSESDDADALLRWSGGAEGLRAERIGLQVAA